MPNDAPIFEVHGDLIPAAIDALAALLLSLVEANEAAEPHEEAA